MANGARYGDITVTPDHTPKNLPKLHDEKEHFFKSINVVFKKLGTIL
jgi:hypothetical protein